ncbi:NucA/NucB deoxyribonuclease domain-containing protein [Streptomyces griseoviridis]|uniref:NucA/NucB deoxyribonuclease domain-containing protein n=1 Tax=Streptomyces griseoviridis TaxID=45398 RepID=UPI003F5751A8
MSGALVRLRTRLRQCLLPVPRLPRPARPGIGTPRRHVREPADEDRRRHDHQHEPSDGLRRRPSITGLSCDEYPIARSREGLSSGGTRRAFDGCQMANVSSGTGPIGVSVCMITATENNAQGGLNTQFFQAERVLDGDPFRVTVS